MSTNLEQIKLNIDKNVSSYVFLQFLDKYLDTINSDHFLSQALLLFKQYHQLESAELAKKVSESQTDLYSIQDEIQERIDDEYPLYALRQMLRINRDFQYIKQYENEAAIPDIVIIIKNEDPYIKYSDRKLSLKDITTWVDRLGHRQNFEEFHLAFMKFIDHIIAKGGVFSKYFDYDSTKGILYFKEKEIEINERKKLTNAHYLLSYLFTHDPFDQHFYSELETDLALLENKSWKSYYDACNDIQNKVKEKTDITDFLDFSSGPKMYVRINPVYSIKNT